VRRSGRGISQRGAVAVLVALMLAVLIGAAGIVLDLGRLFVVKTELQNAVDACALAAARELIARPTSLEVLTRAENSGITVGNEHWADFQGTAVRFETDKDVTFSPELNGAYKPKHGARDDVRYVRCSRRMTGFLPWFMQVLGMGSNAVGATAVASLEAGAAVCAIPLGMCGKKDESGDFDLVKGEWYTGRFSNGPKDQGTRISGIFNWVDFSPHAGGTTEIKDALTGPGICDVEQNANVIHAEPGAKTGIRAAWNSRFGLYKNENKYDVNSAPPDFTGYAYGPKNWTEGDPPVPLERGAYDDFLTHQAAFDIYPGEDVTGLKVGKPDLSSKDDHERGADRRVVTMPIVQCDEWGALKEGPLLGWACALMVRPMEQGGPQDEMKLEYLGLANSNGSPCASYGQPGGTSGNGPKVPTLVQ
jgi:hypothetical protein